MQISNLHMASADHKAPRLSIIFNGQRSLALLDSGASHSFIRPRLTRGLQIDAETMSVKLADSAVHVTTLGRVTQPLEIAGTTAVVTFHILQDMADDIILGRDWMANEGAVLDFPNRCVYFGAVTRSSVFWHDQAPHTAAVYEPITLVDAQAPASHIQEYQRALDGFADVFAEGLHQPTTQIATHRIKLKHDRPFKIRRYQFSQKKKQVIQEEVTHMLAAGVIRRSHSQYSSPIVIVTKKDGKPRFCVDYRQLNAITEDEVAQLPPIRETIKELGEAQVFSSLDLRSGYWQIPMADESIPLTAFSTPEGATYEFTVMPFGLQGAPGTFTKMMAEVLSGLVDNFVKVYLDDIIVYSNNHAEHLRHLQMVLERLRVHGLRCALDKCVFGASALNYLGHRITARYNEPTEHHVLQTQEFPTPKSMKELRSFLGTAGWLREYVKDFAIIAAPLTDLTGKKRFLWTPEADKSFHALKDALSKPLKLHRPLPNMPYFLQTDASSLGMASVLFQRTADGQRRIISCASAKFNATERRYHINEQEVLSVIYACKRHRQFLEDQRFTLITDSRALLWLDKYRDDRAKLTRWALLLQEFTFDVVHCPGRANELPDMLSRYPAEPEREISQVVDEDRLLPPSEGGVAGQLGVRDADGLTLFEAIKQAQLADLRCQTLVAHWRQYMAGERGDWEYVRRFIVEDGLLYNIETENKLLLVPSDLQNRVLHAYHDSTLAEHPGRDETYRQITQRYFWSHMWRHVKTHVRYCLICASTKASARQPTAPLRPRPPVRPWQTISIDTMGPYPETRNKNRFIVVISDTFSKWVEAVATKDTMTVEVLRCLEGVCHRWGFPENIISDGGPQYRSNVWERFLERHHITHYTSPIYHQRANPVERRNQELKKALRAQIMRYPHSQWDARLDEILFALRRRRNQATGMSPSEALLGADLTMPGAWQHPAEQEPIDNAPQVREERIAKAHRRQIIIQRDLFPEPRAAPVHFVIGQRVLARNHAEGRREFGRTWTGPHEVTAIVSDGIYEIDRDGHVCPVHIDDLRPLPPAREPNDAFRGHGATSGEAEEALSGEDSEAEASPDDST